ncbi:MAG: helix-turn-helix transcriptional regulator [Opitutaceae bacterium]|jgi:transcriptional regulator with XRE-family HTH domain
MLTLKTPIEVALSLASRVRQQRLRRGWTQGELADRAGVKTATYVLFERTGRISLVRLLKIMDTLGLLDAFDQIGSVEDLGSLTLKDLVQPQRKRGSRKRP